MLELFGLLGILWCNTESGNVDEDLMPDTDTWRMLHPTEYNPFDHDDPWGENQYAPDEYDDC